MHVIELYYLETARRSYDIDVHSNYGTDVHDILNR